MVGAAEYSLALRSQATCGAHVLEQCRKRKYSVACPALDTPAAGAAVADSAGRLCIRSLFLLSDQPEAASVIRQVVIA
jgi:hypothetical protein